MSKTPFPTCTACGKSLEPEIRAYQSAIGRKGGSKTGKARVYDPEQARAAARARWGTKRPKRGRKPPG
jgi:hypothetical protein